MPPFRLRRAAALVVLLAAAAAVHAAAQRLPVKVVVVTTFEDDYQNPAATGLSSGEAVRWIRGYRLDRVLPLPAGFRPVRLNADGVMETMTGMATGRAAASTMALGLDDRFDFSHAYWLLAGIAGIDPRQGSQGSAAWAEWVVDGDIENLIDGREIPRGWPDGHIPWGGTTPFDPPGPNIGQVYSLRPSLVRWAYRLTQDVPLPDTAGLRRERTRWAGFPAAQHPPAVLIGDNLACANYWQGARFVAWARRWVKLYTGGKGTFTTSSCEDSGFLQAISFLGRAGRVDPRRVLILRTASDYCEPRPGVTAADSLKYGTAAAYMADQEAYDSAFAVGRVVVDELLRHWDRYQSAVP